MLEIECSSSSKNNTHFNIYQVHEIGLQVTIALTLCHTTSIRPNFDQTEKLFLLKKDLTNLNAHHHFLSLANRYRYRI